MKTEDREFAVKVMDKDFIKKEKKVWGVSRPKTRLPPVSPFSRPKPPCARSCRGRRLYLFPRIGCLSKDMVCVSGRHVTAARRRRTS